MTEGRLGSNASFPPNSQFRAALRRPHLGQSFGYAWFAFDIASISRDHRWWSSERCRPRRVQRLVSLGLRPPLNGRSSRRTPALGSWCATRRRVALDGAMAWLATKRPPARIRSDLNRIACRQRERRSAAAAVPARSCGGRRLALAADGGVRDRVFRRGVSDRIYSTPRIFPRERR